jgi:hypothetical protein
MYRPTETPPAAPPKPAADPAELKTERLEHELCSLASHLTAGMARWIALVDEYDRRQGWGRWGGIVGELATNADALCLIAESFLAHGARERAGPQRQRLIVHVDAHTLSRDAPGRCELENGPRIPPETARRLGCDGELQLLVKPGRRMLYLGRRTRSIPPALNLALRERDGRCRFPGCTHRRCAHHIVPWVLGGRTDLDNLILLCRRHHRLVHEGGSPSPGTETTRSSSETRAGSASITPPSRRPAHWKRS